MTRTENDLLDALHDLEQEADQHGAPSTASILSATSERRTGADRDSASRFPRWLAPLAVGAAVAATAVTVVTISAQRGDSRNAGTAPGGRAPSGPTAAHRSSTAVRPSVPAPKPNPAAAAGAILDDAAAALDAAPGWTPPAPQDFYYVRTTAATTWTSVSGRQAGDGRAAAGSKIWISGCAHGQLVSAGESGPCTLDQVPHYRADAPTTPAAWDAYLEQIAPGAKAANAQGKIIVQVLHQDLVAPRAAAALLRYTTSCPGLHTLAVQPVGGRRLVGVTCTSMTNGSYGLVFDAGTHEFAGFVGVTAGEQDGPAELIRKTGIVTALGRTP